MQLRRAQLVLMLAVLLPTILLTGIGVIMLVVHKSTTMLVAGILVTVLCTSGITGYILGTVFVGKGASLVRVQNDFVSSVSHELRTPLTSIRLLIESLRTGRLENHEASQVLSLLGRETDRLEALVNRVLELSKLQSTHTYSREMIKIASLVEESLAAFDAATLTLPTRIAVTIEPGLAIAGDRSTLVRALVNLLTNAWKYTGDDKQISIDARADGRWVEIAVHDNGVGIDRDEHGAIFEQFNRGEAAIRSGVPGVGLGLAFVRTIVHSHKGKIEFTSRPGDTTFRIKLKRRGESAGLPVVAEALTDRRVARS
ncbi:MAG: integral rane sensor signal transduction histidine kinase [Myxococcales bacterium]|nr:integral rane sensor signal transduction histidine kinase [Myxococcales bacterium]